MLGLSVSDIVIWCVTGAIAVTALAVVRRRLKVFQHPSLPRRTAILSGILLVSGPVLATLPVPFGLPLNQGGAHAASFGLACFIMGLFWPSIATSAAIKARGRLVVLWLFIVGAGLMLGGFVSRAFLDLPPIHAGVTKLGDALSFVGFLIATGGVVSVSRGGAGTFGVIGGDGGD